MLVPDSHKPKRKSWTFRASRGFIARADLSPQARILALAMVGAADSKGRLSLSNDDLAKLAGMSATYVKRFLAELSDAKVIEWTTTTDGRGHRHRTFNIWLTTGPNRLFFPPSKWNGFEWVNTHI